ncbi:MAG: hypothetical protein ACTHOH_08325 [Lysobacteraceae bacterium]
MSRRRLAWLAAAAAVAYVVAYAGYRQTHAERWPQDGRTYVLFGSRASYLTSRPLSHLDQALAGTGAHPGPHR